MQTCYACHSISTSDEHVPAKCFFPESNRDQLITVHSCAEHNEDTSKDDEYVRNMIVTLGENNPAAFTLLTGKVSRSFDRSPRLKAASFSSLRFVDPPASTDTKIVEIDRSRFDLVFTKVYRGLIANAGGRMFSPVNVLYRDFVFSNGSAAPDVGIFDQFRSMDLAWLGANQTVFRYRGYTASDNLPPIIQVEFYEVFSALIVPSPLP